MGHHCGRGHELNGSRSPHLTGMQLEIGPQREGLPCNITIATIGDKPRTVDVLTWPLFVIYTYEVPFFFCFGCFLLGKGVLVGTYVYCKLQVPSLLTLYSVSSRSPLCTFCLL